MIKTSPLVSVIVPVYNVGPYLDQCLSSLVGQVYEDIEIIIIDDGSTDDGASIAKSYSADDNRVILIEQENFGLSAARNAGLEIAGGEYVLFVDGDDWVDIDVCSHLIDLAQTRDADVVVYGLKFHSDSNVRCRKNFVYDGGIGGEEYLLESMKSGGFSPTVCNKLFRKSIIDTIVFPVGLRYEDIYFSFMSILSSDRVCATNDFFYNYRIGRSGSITSKISIDSFFDLRSIYQKLYRDLHSMGLGGICNNKYYRSDMLARFDNEIIIKLFDKTSFEGRDETVDILKNDSWLQLNSKNYLLSPLSFVHKLNYMFFFSPKVLHCFAKGVYLFRSLIRGW